jgi:hypothetical protein
VGERKGKKGKEEKEEKADKMRRTRMERRVDCVVHFSIGIFLLAIAALTYKYQSFFTHLDIVISEEQMTETIRNHTLQ